MAKDILLTFTVPCYNSEKYMSTCINSLLPAGKNTEILIIDDGSTDKTGKIADDYANKYPDRVRVIHQENGGHGEGVNQGIKNASGKYFKVVDSDDSLNQDALEKIMKKLEYFEKNGETVDALFSNYIYDHVIDEKKHVIKYTKNMPVNMFFTWDEVGHFSPPHYILMHSVIYRTELLRICGLKLPKHTFYVDNIYVYQPLPYLKTMYYMDVDLYKYFIGRDDQSVNEKKMVAQVDQQIYITKYMTKLYDLKTISEHNSNLGRYMMHYLSVMYAISFIFLTIEGSDNSLKKIEDLKQFLKDTSPDIYNKIIYRSIAFFSNIKGEKGRKAVISCYHVLQKIYKFN